MVAEELELAEFFEGHGVAEVDVRRGGIDAELDPQRAAEAEFFQQFLFGKHLGGASGELGELVFGRHFGEKAEILKSGNEEEGVIREVLAEISAFQRFSFQPFPLKVQFEDAFDFGGGGGVIGDAVVAGDDEFGGDGLDV